MHTYKTVEEKAAEWDLSPRHVQYLCRNGRIGGAIKHAEVWFIPGDAPSPAKKTKSGAKDFDFVGTKRKIFHSAIELFMRNGFDSVSLKDIAERVEIRQSTIYNHFKSKQEILDVIYDFYCHYHQKDRPSLRDMEEKLHSESPMAIIEAISYEFKADYLQAMSDITKIILQRIGFDDRAREIAKTLLVDNGVKYVETVFNMGVAGGRFAPFDTHAMAVLINSIRIFSLYNWVIDPSAESMKALKADEQTLYQYAAGYIRDLKS